MPLRPRARTCRSWNARFLQYLVRSPPVLRGQPILRDRQADVGRFGSMYAALTQALAYPAGDGFCSASRLLLLGGAAFAMNCFRYSYDSQDLQKRRCRNVNLNSCRQCWYAVPRLIRWSSTSGQGGRCLCGLPKTSVNQSLRRLIGAVVRTLFCWFGAEVAVVDCPGLPARGG